MSAPIPARFHLLRVAAASLFALWTFPASAGPEQARGGQAPSEDYGGIVLNQTVTVAGQNFYRCFVTYWQDKHISGRYAISVHERPSARWGSQVWIEYAQNRVFQASLPSSFSNIKALSEQAAEIAQQKVVDVEVDRLLFREAEFGPDEI